MLITGDTLFSDCYGRTDLKSGNISDMKKSIEKICNRFNNDLVIYPGHGKIARLKDVKRKIAILLALE